MMCEPIEERWILRIPKNFDINELNGKTINLKCDNHDVLPRRSEDLPDYSCQSFECCSLTTKDISNSEARLTRLTKTANTIGIIPGKPTAGYLSFRRKASLTTEELKTMTLPKRLCVEPVESILKRVTRSQTLDGGESGDLEESVVDVRKDNTLRKKKKSKSKKIANN